MKITYICSGTGDAFYCENCVRDHSLISGLRALGHEVAVVPMYLPVSTEAARGGANNADGGPVIFGAARFYLTAEFPILKKLPKKLLGLLDSRPVLNVAAAFAGSTRAGGHEEMVIGMMMGEEGPYADEFDVSADHILSLKPDAVFVPNAFLLGVLSAVKAKNKDVRTACILQDEHVWVDAFAEEYRDRTWDTVARKSGSADALLAHSGWYRDEAAARTGLSPEKISVIPFGADAARYLRPSAVGRITAGASRTQTSPAAFSIGYLSRLCSELGVDVLAEAYCMLLRRGVLGAGSSLDLCGGYTKDDAVVIKSCRKKISEAGGRMVIRDGFDIGVRNDFLSTISLLAVPVRSGIAFGGFIAEAMAVGVPAVLPDIGGFSEVIRETGAGVLYSPNTPEALADALEGVIRDEGARETMGRAGRAAVTGKYNAVEMARRAAETLPY